MYRVLNCLATQHNFALVLLAAVLCALAAAAAFHIYAQAVESHGKQRLGWLLLTGICSACGIWATHFVAMLAYDGGIPVGYDPVLTIASLLVAVPPTSIGFALALHGTRWLAAVGGGIVGAGVGVMHYTGMRSLSFAGTIQWDPALVVASLVIGGTFTAAALLAYHRLTRPRAVWAGAGLLTLGICGLHFTAMGAAVIVPDPIFVEAARLNGAMIAVAVAGVTALVIMAGLIPSLIANITASQSLARFKELVAELRNQNLRFDTALNNMCQGLAMFDAEQRLVVCNGRYAEIYRLPPELVKPGTTLRQMLEYRCANNLSEAGASQEYLSELDEIFKATTPWTRVRQLSDGRAIAVSFQPMPGGGWVATHEDITQQRRMEQRISYLAHHDELTDLPNRVRLRERLDQALTLVQHGEGLAVLCLDLDRFKDVNDTLGHPVGDALLKAVAERLRGCVREVDTVARLGGDEFAIVQITATQPTDATALAARIIEVMSAPFDLDGHQVAVGTSIGIALTPNDGTDPDQLLKNADLALYRAKSEDRGSYRFFEPEMDQRMQARRRLELDLRRALIDRQFELHYQPLVNLARNEVTGFEALLRWRHPERGNVSPAEFIPLAEETGLIVPIGEWVLRQACVEAARWPDHVTVAVNLSPVQFKCRQLVQMVFNAVATAGLPASRLELEITESVLLQDTDVALETLRQLRNFGVRIALDDFGTGYSSLSYLRSFPFDKIKIDRCFIADLSDTADESLAILRAVAQLGSNLGMTTTAEGVETKEQLERVRAEGCTEMQGYFFSPPKPAKEIVQLFLSGSQRETTAA